MNLEDRVTCGGIIYIDSIDYDKTNQRLTVKFLRDPYQQSVLARILTFTKVSQFDSQALDDDDYLDSLIGLSESLNEGSKEYVICTEQRQLAFRSTEVPQLQELQWKSPFRQHHKTMPLALTP